MAAPGWILGGSALLWLAACAPRGHDVAWYSAHPDARSQTLAACRDNQARRESPDCGNALTSDGDASATTFLDVRAPASRLHNPGRL